MKTIAEVLAAHPDVTDFVDGEGMEWNLSRYKGHNLEWIVNQESTHIYSHLWNVIVIRGLRPKPAAPPQDPPPPFPSDAKCPVVEVFYQSGDDPFVCGAQGHVTPDVLEEIEKGLKDERDDGTFDKGDGSYLFRATHQEGQYGDEGRCEIPPHWELDFIAFKPSPYCEPPEEPPPPPDVIGTLEERLVVDLEAARKAVIAAIQFHHECPACGVYMEEIEHGEDHRDSCKVGQYLRARRLGESEGGGHRCLA